MASTVFINGWEVTHKKFAFDGCHKFYLLADDEEEKEAVDSGYSIFPIEDIAKEFWNSCSLRFIETWKDFEHIVPQCEDSVEFSINGKLIVEDFAGNAVFEDGVVVA